MQVLPKPALLTLLDLELFRVTDKFQFSHKLSSVLSEWMIRIFMIICEGIKRDTTRNMLLVEFISHWSPWMSTKQMERDLMTYHCSLSRIGSTLHRNPTVSFILQVFVSTILLLCRGKQPMEHKKPHGINIWQ